MCDPVRQAVSLLHGPWQQCNVVPHFPNAEIPADIVYPMTVFCGVDLD